MSLNSQITAAFIIAGSLMLGACDSNQPKHDEQPQAANPNGAIVSGRPNDTARPTQPTLTTTKAPNLNVPNPSTITFQKMAVVLDATTKQAVDQLADRSRVSKRITITGFCDRTQIANPTDAAVARAIAVRDELALLGVPLANMQVRVDIKTLKKHAVEVRFE